MKKSTVTFIIYSLLLFALLVALCVCVWKLVTISQSNTSYPIIETYVEQKQDHFNDDNNQTWKQQYFVDTSKWGGPGYPVFLLLGGEWDITYHDFYKPWCHNYAFEFKAICFILEHR